MSIEVAGPVIAAMMTAATPLLFAALGELVVEKSGVLNLGVEGMMLGGAALLLGVTRPKIIWRLMRLAPLLRPLVMRYLLPRFLQQH